MRSKFHKLLVFPLVFLLFSCSPDAETTQTLCEHLNNLTEARYVAHITASFPQREVSFSLDYRFFSKSPHRVTVTSPKEISGVAFSVSEEGSSLEFDGTRLELGRLDDSGLSPLSALPALISVWRSGSCDDAVASDMFGEDAILMTYKKEENEYRTWFSEKDFAPLYAEIYGSGVRIIECKFERTK